MLNQRSLLGLQTTEFIRLYLFSPFCCLNRQTRLKEGSRGCIERLVGPKLPLRGWIEVLK